MSKPPTHPTEDLPPQAAEVRGLVRRILVDENRVDDVVQDTLIASMAGKARGRS